VRCYNRLIYQTSSIHSYPILLEREREREREGEQDLEFHIKKVERKFLLKSYVATRQAESEKEEKENTATKIGDLQALAV